MEYRIPATLSCDEKERRCVKRERERERERGGDKIVTIKCDEAQ